MDITLYEFPISHYSEKVRWALDYKGAKYKKEKLIPGLHLPVTLILTGNSYLPILKIDGKVLGESTFILQELDQYFPEKKLFPENEAIREEVLELVHFADEEIGKHARRVTYAEILNHSDYMKQVLATGLDGLGKMTVQLLSPLLTEGIRRRYSVTEPEISESRRRLDSALDQLNSTLGKNRFLAGDTLTAADITTAALLYPIFLPANFPYELPTQLPPQVKQFQQKYKAHPIVKWAEGIYKQFR